MEEIREDNILRRMKKTKSVDFCENRSDIYGK